MKSVNKTIGSFEINTHLSDIIDNFEEVRRSVDGRVDIKSYINEGRKFVFSIS